MTLKNQPCHRFWGLLHNFAIVQIAIFVLAAPRHVEYPRFFQPSETCKTKTISQEAFAKVGTLNVWTNPFLSQRESGGFSPTHSVLVGYRGYMATYFRLIQTAIFVLSGSQMFRVCQALSMLSVKTEESSTSRLGKTGMLGMLFYCFSAQADAVGLWISFCLYGLCQG